MKKLIICIAILATALVANAQRGGFGMGRGQGGGSIVQTLAREDVQEELALTSEQKEKLLAFTDQGAMRDRMMKMFQDSGMSFEDMRTDEGRKKLQPMMEKMQTEMKKEVEAILTPAQAKRANEITIQLAGNSAIMSPEVSKALGVTDDQKAKIAALQKAQGEAMRSLFEKMQNGEMDRDGMQEAMKKNNDIMNTELGKVMTEAQRTKLTEMGGKKFVKKDQ